MNAWKKFSTSLPDERTQALEITGVGVIRTVGKHECLPVNAVDPATGDEHENVLIPVEAELDFDPKTFTISGGMLSGSKKSYYPKGFEWGIDNDTSITAVANLAKAIKE